MTTAAIHQVNYLPWLGFFNKARMSDIFVMFDVADYSKNNFMNRNKIRIADGWVYLTIPIERTYYRTPFHKVMLPHDDRWQESSYFDSYSDFFEKIYKDKHRTLMELNEKIILYLFEQFGIEVDVVKTTELGISTELKKTDMLISILEGVSADSYLSGEKGREYIEKDKFARAGIGLTFQEYEHPVYRQRFGGFEPFMSAIDALFNLGEKARNLI
jgi:hypothetical protein